MKGSVTKIAVERGFAFVRGEDGVDYFLHASALAEASLESLDVGTVLRFATGDGPRGPRATGATVIG